MRSLKNCTMIVVKIVTVSLRAAATFYMSQMATIETETKQQNGLTTTKSCWISMTESYG